ncbi:TetR/AcrR family transcriptional regulator [Dietzia sp. B32]|uniref:TetR/AcrR family transcriptional regulator n=1 Tax=Dietzia sp. B32 TaxID=2915130 RepID=UPI0021AD9DD8|nr:TetR/AcrR family transcriptional regulator [Dietzia sp. B32]UVE96743.1 TetR/AcrR family transcriptional regulator [Dietzia sp. B32]
MSGFPDTTAGADRAEDRRSELRGAISAAAVDLVIERGLDAVTVDEIARAANVSRRTFFNYFPSKAAACIPDTPPAGRDAVKEFLTDRSVPTMTALARLMWHQVSNARRQSRAFDRFHDMWRREPSVRTQVYEILAGTERELAHLVARREGRAPDSVEAATVAAASIAILRIAVERWRTDEPGALLEYRIRESFDAIRASVAEPADSA